MKEKKIEEARKMLCKYLADIAEEKNISQGDIAKSTGFNQPNVSRMLSGRYPPTLDNFIKLCESVSVYFFIIDKENTKDDLVKLMRDRWGKINQN